MHSNFPKSGPVKIIPYKTIWPSDFQHIANELSKALGTQVLRIDHIGSTSVPGLSAKDVIDIQVTVADIRDPKIVDLLTEAGFHCLSHINSDNYLGETAQENPQLEKRLFKEKPGDRRANIHIRQSGYLNQQFALLFRDYLRAMPEVTTGYLLLKERLAETFPNSIEAYLHFKEPAMGIIFEGAKQWAIATNWQENK